MKKEKLNVYVWKNGKIHINVDYAIMMYTQNGIPPEVLEDWVENEHWTIRAIRMAKAYDKAKKTNYEARAHIAVHHYYGEELKYLKKRLDRL